MADKQTAVEWLEETLSENVLMSPEKWRQIFEQAKAMEKEQSKEDYSVGYSNGQVDSNRTSEQYYNETFKSE